MSRTPKLNCSPAALQNFRLIYLIFYLKYPCWYLKGEEKKKEKKHGKEKEKENRQTANQTMGEQT